MKSKSLDVAVVCGPVLAVCWQRLYSCCCWRTSSQDTIFKVVSTL